MTAQDEALQFSLTLNVTIRRLRKDDLRKLEWYGQFKHYRRLFMRSYQGQLEGTRLMLVATVQDYPIARLFIQYNSHNRYISDGQRRGYLYSFHVMELFQRQGIGTRLIMAAETILRRNGFQVATIAVAKDNQGALRLYQRHGYEIFAEEEGRWRYYDHRNRLQHVHEPCWLLEKTLGQSDDSNRA